VLLCLCKVSAILIFHVDALSFFSLTSLALPKQSVKQSSFLKNKVILVKHKMTPSRLFILYHIRTFQCFTSHKKHRQKKRLFSSSYNDFSLSSLFCVECILGTSAITLLVQGQSGDFSGSFGSRVCENLSTLFVFKG